MKHILTSACFLLCATAFVACEPEPEPTPEPAPDNRSDYERLRDNVGIDIVSLLTCKECHDKGSDYAVASRLNFDSTSGEDVEKAITDYILLDNPYNATLAIAKPLGDFGTNGHAGGDILANEDYADEKAMWVELVDAIAADNPPTSVGTDAEINELIMTKMVISQTDQSQSCIACHTADAPLSPEAARFTIAYAMENEPTLAEVEASMTAYLQADDSNKIKLLAKPRNLIPHYGGDLTIQDATTANMWTAFVERNDI